MIRFICDHKKTRRHSTMSYQYEQKYVDTTAPTWSANWNTTAPYNIEYVYRKILTVTDTCEGCGKIVKVSVL